MGYASRIKKRKQLQLALLAGLFVALLGYIYLLSQPSVVGYTIQDDCGPIGGIVSHPIPNQDVCSNVCRAQCSSYDQEFKEAEFELKDPECNACACYCEDPNKKLVRIE